MKTKQGAKILQIVSGIVIFIILVGLSKSSSKSTYSDGMDYDKFEYQSEEFSTGNDKIKISTSIDATLNAEKIANRLSCNEIVYKNENFRKFKTFLLKDIYLQTPSKYSVCVPVKSGSKTFRKEIGKLYRVGSDPLKKKFLNASSALDIKGRNFHASYMIWRSQQRGYGQSGDQRIQFVSGNVCYLTILHG